LLSRLFYYGLDRFVSVCVGELKVPQITHADSLFISELTDEILRQIGVKYDAE